MLFHEVKLSEEHQGTLPIMPRNFGAIWKVWPLVLSKSAQSVHGCPTLRPWSEYLLWLEEIRRSPPGMVLKPVVNNGINYQPQLVSRMSSIIAKLSYSDSLDHWLPFLTEAKPVKPP